MRNYLTVFVLITISSFSHSAETEKIYSDWFVVRNDGDLIAGTSNQAGNILGYRCYAESNKCLHVLIAGIDCKANGSYPVLVNSDHAALSMTAVCNEKESSGSELLLTNFDEIHSILEKGTYVGFAIPMESGYFKVVRFSLTGSAQAMDYAEKNISPTNFGEIFL